jgi:uncharacterized phiE125 gp8 family phage protein
MIDREAPAYLLRRTVEPTLEPVTTAEAKEHMSVDHNLDDALISGFVKAATRNVEELIGKALLAQTWELKLPAVHSRAMIFLPRFPVISITSIAYLDAAEETQAATVADYLLYGDEDCAWLEPKRDKTWPAAILDRRDALTITFVAGFGTAAADVPAHLKLAIKMAAAHYYSNRDAVGSVEMHELPMGVQLQCGISRKGWVAA